MVNNETRASSNPIGLAIAEDSSRYYNVKSPQLGPILRDGIGFATKGIGTFRQEQM